jgi:integrase
VLAERMTFNELTSWYLDLPSVAAIESFPRFRQCLNNFNAMFGERIISSLKPLDLETYQYKREKAGRAAATIDLEISVAQTMVTKAFYNDLVDERTFKAFKRVKPKLKKGSNARRRTLSVEEYLKLCQVAPPHFKAMLVMAYHTGMRLAEIRHLRWANIDREKGFIRLSADMTKEKRIKNIPINPYVKQLLAGLPRALAHDFVITYRGKPIKSEGGCRKAHKNALEKVGMVFGRDEEGGVVFHDIRRTVKTNMLAAGMDKVHRDLILGHSLQGMDTYYLSPSEADLHRAMSIYTAWLDGQFANVDHIVDQNIKIDNNSKS